MIINVGYALVGQDLELVKEVHIEVVDGTVTHIGRGYVGDASMDLRHGIAIPALINAHLHILDYAFPEYEANLSLEEAVSEPRGLKHRLLSSLTVEDITNACSSVFAKLYRSGVTTTIIFSELPQANKIIKEAAKKYNIESILLGRPRGEIGVLEVLRDADGLGLDSPLRYTRDELVSLKEICRAEGKLISTHVAENKVDYERGDLELAINQLDADILVHVTHLKREDIEVLAERGKTVVVCLRSNMRLGAGIPPLAELLTHGVDVLLGTDNAGIVEPDLWREMEAAYDILRLSGKRVDAKDILKMATVNASKIKTLGVDNIIEEGVKADFIILNADEFHISKSRDIYASLVKRGSPLAILQIIKYR
jgi:cytosine/adenosine deaminase-related metal-dependent hydrolase